MKFQNYQFIKSESNQDALILWEQKKVNHPQKRK